jgi:hypothetical protein
MRKNLALGVGALVLTLGLLFAFQGRTEPAGAGGTPVYVPLLVKIIPPPTPSPTGRPDLLIAYHWIIYKPGTCPWGGPGEISVRVKNVGSGDAGSFFVTINGQTTSLANLPAHSEAFATVQFSSGPVAYVEAEVDPTHAVDEDDETNNTFSIIFTPPPACPN